VNPIKNPISLLAALAATVTFGLAPAAIGAPAPARPTCCRVPAGTPVEIELVNELTSANANRGDTFAIRLAQPLVIDGQVVLRAGAPGVGEVIDVRHRGIGGKPAKMVLAVDYLLSSQGRVPLSTTGLASHGHDNSAPAGVLEIGGLASLPLGVAGIVLSGGGVTFKPGSVAIARVSTSLALPPLGAATESDIAAASAVAASAEPEATRIPVPPPPPGMGQIVFFRAKSLLGTAQWFNVREDGHALGRLDNGAYFIQPEAPGVHSFTDKLEPELKDRLKIEVAAGQTYYVEGTLTAGLVLSASDLEPSTVDKFNKAAKNLKLAKAPAPDADKDAPPPAS